ncbi:hypothetical protein PLIP_a0659 [Pseudoalteromonas lipolytica LMEB 39]|nr:hypothetical protein [Pseudoalteromonas lipolytica LMEB 39]
MRAKATIQSNHLRLSIIPKPSQNASASSAPRSLNMRTDF